ncbi:amino acid permease [Vibrio ishigakensis]|uniref:Amino acid permease n=1 Tax=Vibrio ishigakensis TaxID=1481914 RepID=A0A0B8QDM1_9VIBR|nr:amino acid permease [Vibrio ishigakensis]
MEEKLQPKYGLGTAVSLVVGIVVGIGIFFKAGPVLQATGGNGTYAIIAWVAAALLTTIAAIVISEIASMGSKTGGLMSFSETAWGERFGFFVAGFKRFCISRLSFLSFFTTRRYLPAPSCRLSLPCQYLQA